MAGQREKGRKRLERKRARDGTPEFRDLLARVAALEAVNSVAVATAAGVGTAIARGDTT